MAPALKAHQKGKKGTEKAQGKFMLGDLSYLFIFTSLWKTSLAATSTLHQYAISEDAFSGAVIKGEKKRLWQVYYFQRPEEIETLLCSPLKKIDVSSLSQVLYVP